MKKTTLFLLAALFSFSIILISCEDDDHDDNEIEMSTYDEDESHKHGQNCMVCHFNGGSGEGVFSISGSIFDTTGTTPFPKATVYFHTEPNGGGELKYRIEVDKLGNFYTTQISEFGMGLYVSVEGNEDIRYMANPVTSGSCSSCHGNTAAKLKIH